MTSTAWNSDRANEWYNCTLHLHQRCAGATTFSPTLAEYLRHSYNIVTGRTYIGRSAHSPYLRRFQEHVEKDTDHYDRALRNRSKGFVAIQQPENVPEGTELKDFRKKRESSWIHRLDILHAGSNSRRVMAELPAPLAPCPWARPHAYQEITTP